jgi:hypothetical protein
MSFGVTTCRAAAPKKSRPRRGLGALASACLCAAAVSMAEAPTTHALALTMHATVVPELHIVPPEERDASVSPADPFSFATGVVCVAGSASSNRTSFALHARNLTMLEAVDLICFLSDTPYAFDGNRLVFAPTNLPPVELKQSAKKEKALIAIMKGITIPEVTFRPPATIIDAIEFFYQASVDCDESAVLSEQRGVNFAVKNPHLLPNRRKHENGLPVISAREPSADSRPAVSALSATFCTLYEAVTNVCDAVEGRFSVRGNTVVIAPAAVKRRDEPGQGP